MGEEEEEITVGGLKIKKIINIHKEKLINMFHIFLSFQFQQFALNKRDSKNVIKSKKKCFK